MKKVKRKYDSGHRKALAEQTRKRILDSARRLFRDRGYAQTTIDEIATDARIAVPTLYATYGGKRSILLKLLDEMEQAADASSLLSMLEQSAGDEQTQLSAFIDFSVRFFATGADIIRIAQLAGRAEPDIAALWDTGNARRLAAVSKVLADWERRGVLREGLNTSRASDILWSLTSAELQNLLTHERGWSHKEFQDWLNNLASEQLLKRKPRGMKASQ